MKEIDINNILVFDFSNLYQQENSIVNCFGCDSCNCDNSYNDHDDCDSCDSDW